MSTESMSSLANKSPRPRAVVMADVAKLAGVSLQTVSRVINDSPHVRAATRAARRGRDAQARVPAEPGGARAGHRAARARSAS